MDEISEKLGKNNEKMKIRHKKRNPIIIRLIIYFLNIIVGGLFGVLSPVVVIGVYPFFWPVVGFLGPIGYIITQFQIAKRLKPLKDSKIAVISYIFGLLGSIATYLLGLYYGLTTYPRLGTGALYGVFKKELKIVKPGIKLF